LYAASGLNRQTGKILAVTNKEVRDKLSALNAKYDPKKRQDPYYNAPVILCVFVEKGQSMGIYDGSLVLGNMMLAAKALGLGSCWIHRAKEVFNDPEGKEILAALGLTQEYEGIGNLALGYPEIMNSGMPARKEDRVYWIE
jgi:nitroreductase